MARWKTKRVQDGAWVKLNMGDFLQQREEEDPEFDIELKKMRDQMALTFGQVGLANDRVVPGITSSGRDAFRGTPLWPGGPRICDLPGDARPDLPSTSNDDSYNQQIWDLWLTDFNPDFWPNVFEGDDKAKEPAKGSKGQGAISWPSPAGPTGEQLQRRGGRLVGQGQQGQGAISWPSPGPIGELLQRHGGRLVG